MLHAYDFSKSTFIRLRERNGGELKPKVAINKGKSVLVDAAFAATIYTPEKFYVDDCFQKWMQEAAENGMEISREQKQEKKRELRKSWAEGEALDYVKYEKKARDHAALQEGMKDELIDTLNRQNQRSFLSLQKVTLTPYPFMNITCVDTQTHTLPHRL